MQPYDRNDALLRATVRKFKPIRHPDRVRAVRTTMGARRKRAAVLARLQPEGSTS